MSDLPLVNLSTNMSVFLVYGDYEQNGNREAADVLWMYLGDLVGGHLLVDGYLADLSRLSWPGAW